MITPIWFVIICCVLLQPSGAQSVRDAVESGNITKVRRSVQQLGVTGVNLPDQNGTTPLHVAVNKGLTDIVKLLIEAGADVNAHGDAGWTPLHYALSHQNYDIIASLVSHGASSESLTSDGSMPIHVAARDGGEEAVAYALIFGSEVDARSRDGNTPLAVAAWYGKADVARLLIGAGADTHSKNLAGNTPLDEALRGGRSEIATIITNHNLDIKAYEALMKRREEYWPNVRKSYANWQSPRALTKIEYKSDFTDGIVGPGWSTLPTIGIENAPLRVSSTPKTGRKFLGDFGSQSVRLTLDNLPPHREMAVMFDLYVVRSMDGCDINSGPDIWNLSVLGGVELLNTTFANTCAYRSGDKPLEFYKALKIQAYPGEYPIDHNAFCTDADEVNTLGYRFNIRGRDCDMDSVYKIRYTFPHAEGTATLNFSAIGLEALDNESWGITNVEVSVDSVPPPAVKQQITSPHPAATAARPNPAAPRSAVTHKATRTKHTLATTKRKPTVHKPASKTTSGSRLHDKKKPLTP